MGVLVELTNRAVIVRFTGVDRWYAFSSGIVLPTRRVLGARVLSQWAAIAACPARELPGLGWPGVLRAGRLRIGTRPPAVAGPPCPIGTGHLPARRALPPRRGRGRGPRAPQQEHQQCDPVGRGPPGIVATRQLTGNLALAAPRPTDCRHTARPAPDHRGSAGKRTGPGARRHPRQFACAPSRPPVNYLVDLGCRGGRHRSPPRSDRSRPRRPQRATPAPTLTTRRRTPARRPVAASSTEGHQRRASPWPPCSTNERLRTQYSLAGLWTRQPTHHPHSQRQSASADATRGQALSLELHQRNSATRHSVTRIDLSTLPVVAITLIA